MKPFRTALLAAALAALLAGSIGCQAIFPTTRSTDPDETPQAISEALSERNKAGHGDESSMEHQHMQAMPQSAANRRNPVEATSVSVDQGQKLFEDKCARCHGASGLGDGPDSAKYDPRPANLRSDHTFKMTDGQLFWIISNGSGGSAMPAWKDEIGERDRWNLVNLIRSLRP